MFTTIIGWIGAIVMLVGCTFALTTGGRGEKLGATAYLLAWLFSSIVRYAFGSELTGIFMILAIDTALLCAFGALVWKAPNNWPVWATAMQVLVLSTQLLYTTNFKPTISAYYTIVNFASFGIIAALVYGSVVAWRERSAVGLTVNDIGRYS